MRGLVIGVASVVVAVCAVGIAVFASWESGTPWLIRRNHIILRLASALDVPPWLLRAIVPKAPKAYVKDGVAVSEGTAVHDGRSVQFRRFAPEGSDPSKVVMWTHGGGWVVGDPSEKHVDAACRDLARWSRVTVLAVRYRKCPEHYLTDSAEDVETALLWVATQGYARVVVGGDSAGGTLSLHAALHHPHLVEQLVLVYPGLEQGLEHADEGDWVIHSDVVDFFRRNHRLPEAGPSQRATMAAHLLRDDEALHAAAVSRLPPVLLVSAGLDPLLSGCKKLEDKLMRIGVPVTHVHYPESVHGFFSFGLDDGLNATRTVAECLFKEKRE